MANTTFKVTTNPDNTYRVLYVGLDVTSSALVRRVFNNVVAKNEASAPYAAARLMFAEGAGASSVVAA